MLYVQNSLALSRIPSFGHEDSNSRLANSLLGSNIELKHETKMAHNSPIKFRHSPNPIAREVQGEKNNQDMNTVENCNLNDSKKKFFTSYQERRNILKSGVNFCKKVSNSQTQDERDVSIKDFDFGNFWKAFVEGTEIPSMPSNLLMCNRNQLFGLTRDMTISHVKSRAPTAHALAYSSCLVGTGRNASHMCLYCQREFKRRDRLFMHTVIHTDEYPYVCKYQWCKKEFRWYNSLKKHYKMHEKEEGMKAKEIIDFSKT